MFQNNGVRQGGVFSPKLFTIYVDDLSHEHTLCKSGRYINDLCLNHVVYAEDICLTVRSAIALQKCWICVLTEVYEKMLC